MTRFTNRDKQVIADALYWMSRQFDGPTVSPQAAAFLSFQLLADSLQTGAEDVPDETWEVPEWAPSIWSTVQAYYESGDATGREAVGATLDKLHQLFL